MDCPQILPSAEGFRFNLRFVLPVCVARPSARLPVPTREQAGLSCQPLPPPSWHRYLYAKGPLRLLAAHQLAPEGSLAWPGSPSISTTRQRWLPCQHIKPRPEQAAPQPPQSPPESSLSCPAGPDVLTEASSHLLAQVGAQALHHQAEGAPRVGSRHGLQG